MRGAKAGGSPPRRRPHGKYTFKYSSNYVDPVVSAIERPDLDKVFKRLRDNSG